MQSLEVSGAVRPIYGSLGVKGLSFQDHLYPYRGHAKKPQHWSLPYLPTLPHLFCIPHIISCSRFVRKSVGTDNHVINFTSGKRFGLFDTSLKFVETQGRKKEASSFCPWSLCTGEIKHVWGAA